MHNGLISLASVEYSSITTDDLSPTSTAASINYFTPLDGIRPHLKFNAIPKEGEMERNYNHVEEIIIENVHRKEDSNTLDTTGFQFFNSPVKLNVFTNDVDIKK
ncbi:hypothetical protein BDQ12DRAFT_766417 [Crucibulum laeve]|uniref:Uncharacterized protein n=1 Tax=Crucibulum laeve TaxID=68775 RepID=A0A5C3LMT5_9AGAR|nr:hypothetical protein BDQ12DRAFT_766417 [Crucibulum laeve]